MAGLNSERAGGLTQFLIEVCLGLIDVDADPQDDMQEAGAFYSHLAKYAPHLSPMHDQIVRPLEPRDEPCRPLNGLDPCHRTHEGEDGRTVWRDRRPQDDREIQAQPSGRLPSTAQPTAPPTLRLRNNDRSLRLATTRQRRRFVVGRIDLLEQVDGGPDPLRNQAGPNR